MGKGFCHRYAAFMPHVWLGYKLVAATRLVCSSALLKGCRKPKGSVAFFQQCGFWRNFQVCFAATLLGKTIRATLKKVRVRQ